MSILDYVNSKEEMRLMPFMTVYRTIRRGRGRNARRDSMGRYASEEGGSSYEDGGSSYRGGSSSYEMGGSSYRGGSSYEGGSSKGYSRGDAKDHMMNKLGMMMEDADPKEREALKKCMREIERA